MHIVNMLFDGELAQVGRLNRIADVHRVEQLMAWLQTNIKS